MIFDYELMFLDDTKKEMGNQTSGIIGATLDLSGAGQGKGFPAVIALAFTEDTTATADPDINFLIETADNKNFTDSATIPLMLPSPLKKADMPEGTVLTSPLPQIGLQRYVRLKLDTDSAINMLGVKAGFVLDATMK